MRSSARVAALALTAAVGCTAIAAVHVAARPAVRVTAALDRTARLGGGSALRVGMSVDTRQRRAALRSVQIRYDAHLGVTTSGLGIDACRRPAAAYDAIVLPGDPIGRSGCPVNSLMATGTVRGEIRLDPEATPIPENATIAIYAGAIVDDRLQIDAQVDGLNPIGARLVYAGELIPARPPWGGTLQLALPPLPPRWGAEITLADVDLSIGASTIVYRDPVTGRRYRPEGVQIPSRCPRGGFRVQTTLTFADGLSDRISVAIRCPRVR
ncbi:hypothetical protein VSS74_01420 [Conexibacter stalactiti]|uniref:Uncharacterized protein n=1 Tax=Conexibacter stalactiti TaxID=1940611 RepID=A0ABU4HI77_9ACTN|nr:hypothetical protein [Conexibacter stalactiti]MDW5592977.1 hypothetical protein [Conexibacter stalactiti]MEC5033618.1 hypothetical protein [Conexibacter stalactiti]